MSTKLFNKNEGKEIRPSQARQRRVQGCVNRCPLRPARGETGTRCRQAIRHRQIRLDSEPLACRRSICESVGSRMELGGIKPPVRRVTVRYRRQTSPICLPGRWSDCDDYEASLHPFSFVGDLLRRHRPPSANCIKAKDRHSPVKAFPEKVRRKAQNCNGQISFAGITAFTPETFESQRRLRHKTEELGKRVPSFHVGFDGLAATLLVFPEVKFLTARPLRIAARLGGTGRFDRLVGNGNRVLENRVHPHIGVCGTLFFHRSPCHTANLTSNP